MERSGRGPTWSTIPEFAWKDWGKQRQTLNQDSRSPQHEAEC
jgi:hypothetical protein